MRKRCPPDDSWRVLAAALGVVAMTVVPAVVSSVGSSGKAEANPIACATVRYSVQSGSSQYLVNNCYIPSTFTPHEGVGPQCVYATAGVTATVCASAELSHPAP